jgi:hypothetical protein
MESEHRQQKMEFWLIVYFSWTAHELDALSRLWNAFQDANLSA